MPASWRAAFSAAIPGPAPMRQRASKRRGIGSTARLPIPRNAPRRWRNQGGTTTPRRRARGKREDAPNRSPTPDFAFLLVLSGTR